MVFDSGCVYADLKYGPPGGELFRSRLYYISVDSAPDTAKMANIADAIMALFAGAFAAILTDTHVFAGVDAWYTSGTTQLEGVSSDSEVPGTATGSPEPEEVVVCIQRRTGLQGRNHRGRLFLSGVPELFTDPDSTLTATAKTKYSDFAKKVNTPVTSVAGIDLQPAQPDFKTTPITLNPITICRVNMEVKSRRDRRFPKRGLIVPQTV